MRTIVCLCLSLLLSISSLNVSAESNDAEARLAVAWSDYKAAVAAGDVERTVETAREASTRAKRTSERERAWSPRKKNIAR